MTDNQRMLIQHVINNDLPRARQYANVILRTSKTAKDQAFCDSMLKKIEEQSKKGMEIPGNLKGIIQTDCTAYAFDPSRYFLTEREKQCLDHIKEMYSAGGKLAERGIHYANAVLLHGASGTGKTTFAQYVAKEMELPFLYVSMTQLMNSFMGKTAQNMELVFTFISSLPCVCVLDELDSIGFRRGDDTGVSGELKRVLLCVMQNLDQLPNNVILIAATNRPDAIDEALMRRFTLKHEVLPLNTEEAKKMIRTYMSALDLKWIGSFDTFLNVCVSNRQSGLPFEKDFIPAAITDSLNEAIAQAFNSNAEEQNPTVELYQGGKTDTGPKHPMPGIIENSSNSVNMMLAGKPIGIPEEYKVDKNGCRKFSPIERRLEIYDLVDLECPSCGKKRLRIGRYDGIMEDFPEYGITCDECNWESPTGTMSDYGEVTGEFKTWYAAWIYLGKPKDRIKEDLTKEFGYALNTGDS